MGSTWRMLASGSSLSQALETLTCADVKAKSLTNLDYEHVLSCQQGNQREK